MIVRLTTYEKGTVTCSQLMDLAPFDPLYDDLKAGMSLVQDEPATGRRYVWQPAEGEEDE